MNILNENVFFRIVNLDISSENTGIYSAVSLCQTKQSLNKINKSG